MRRMIYGILKIVGVLLLIAIGWITWHTLKPVRLDAIQLKTLNDVPADTDSLLHGRNTVLNFWATWCKPCIEEMPMLDAVSASLDTTKWQMLLVSDEPVERIQNFISKRNYRMKYMHSSLPLSEMGISSLPKTVIIDEERKVLYQKTGALTMGHEQFLALLMRYED